MSLAHAVTALERVALASRAHLAHDNSAALARKCTWALADIGTADAYAALERLSHAKKRRIRVYAWRRITEWAREMSRKPSGSYAPSGSKHG
ncbi:MAG: hypothetical protein JWM10_4270 [Myxococcaceae bacterium]|nr:hypothetical protein [Myxococcaceae bacterium]